VNYTVFEVVGASDWARHEGGLVGVEKPKMSCPDSVLVDETWGASVLGRGNLGGGRKAHLRKGGGGYSAGMQSESWFEILFLNFYFALID
jgi:hypothetical protein